MVLKWSAQYVPVLADSHYIIITIVRYTGFATTHLGEDISEGLSLKERIIDQTKLKFNSITYSW